MAKDNATRKSDAPIVVDSYVDETSKWKTLDELLQSFPDPRTELADGVVWGSVDTLFTPAFWKIQYYLSDFSSKNSHRLGESILEEIVACLLGGYGLPAEVGLKAFYRLKERGLIVEGAKFKALLTSLEEPFQMSNGRAVTYRFYNQKSKFIADLLNRRDLDSIPVEHDLILRNWLMTVNGVGPKTASWITRNWLNSERVAILDIHLIRAGIIAGIFEKDIDINKSYFDLEKKFLNFCKALEVRPSSMDALIWWRMKNSGRIALDYLNQ